MIEPKIIKVGRTPRIEGTRISVFDVVDYLQAGWHRDLIADQFDLSSHQVDAAIRYIEENRDEVMAEYEKILARHARGNPPEIQAKIDAGHERFLARVSELRQAKSREALDAGHSGGH
jgi:uncharacterized protein (DUF433 family)